MCPLLCLSVVRTILLIVYGYDSLLVTVKSQKSDRGRRYSAFRVLPVPQPDRAPASAWQTAAPQIGLAVAYYTSQTCLRRPNGYHLSYGLEDHSVR